MVDIEDRVDLRAFNESNMAKDFRDKVNVLYDELACLKIKSDITNTDKDQILRRFMRKVATHALNALQETREEFMRKYLNKYHQKMQE